MALSEHEEALLQQMEEALYAEDPRFASRIERTTSHSPSRGRIILGIIGALAGLGVVIAGAMTSLIWLGAVGFALMVAGIVWAVTPVKTDSGNGSHLGTVETDGTIRSHEGGAATRGFGKKRKSGGSAGSGGFMNRLEERWEKRRRDQW